MQYYQFWDGEIDLFYMPDHFTPRWKIDVTLENETCFYEENGLSKKEGHSFSIYDCLGGDACPQEGR